MNKSRRVLLVCTGNTCRSPLAEVMLKQLRPDWEVRSAGLMASPGAPAAANSVLVARQRGLDLSSHQSTQLDRSLVEWADLILCLGENHRRALGQMFPEARDKTLVLREAAGLEKPWDISDPVGQSLAVYEECARQIDEALQALAVRV